MASTQEIARLVTRMTGDGSGHMRMLKEVEAATQRATKTIEKQVGSMSSAFSASFGSMTSGILAATGVMNAGAAAMSTLKSAFSLAAEAEENEVAFGTMLQNVEQGKQMVKDLQALAAATPMDTSTLQTAAKLLLQFGVEGKNVIGTLQLLGDATGGNAERMKSMSLAFGQMASAGRLMGQDLLQMINAGFNPLQEISRTTGRSMIELKKDMEKGAISTGMVVKAFQTATGGGGRFNGLMEKQSRTLSGLFSTMKDDISATLRTIGKELIEQFALKQVIKDVSALAAATTAWLSGMSSDLKGVIAAIGVATVAVLGLTAVIVASLKVVNVLSGGVLIAIGVVVTAIAAVAGLIVSLGGVTSTFKLIRETAIAAWDWLKPIRQAIGSFFGSLWYMAVGAWTLVRDFAIDTWKAIFGSASLNWSQIRQTIVDAILFAEYSMLNFGKVAGVVWAGLKLKVTEYGNELVHFFTSTLPGAVRWAFNNIGKLAKGMSVDAFVAPERQQGEVEKALRKQFDAASGALGKDFAKFREEKLKLWATEEEARKAGEKPGVDMGSAMGGGVAKGLKDSMGKVDAVLYRSAEALSRVLAQRDRFSTRSNTTPGAGAEQGVRMPGAPAPMPKNMVPVERPIPEPAKEKEAGQTNVLLKQVVMVLEQIKDAIDDNGALAADL